MSLDRESELDGKAEVPAFIVFHDKTLEEIARQKPRELWQLANVSGIGPTKLERYGDEVLQR